MSKARILADLISDNAELADGAISVAEVVGAAPLASPTFTGTVTSTGNIVLGDNDKAILGDGSDFEIYHNNAQSTNFLISTTSANISIGTGGMVGVGSSNSSLTVNGAVATVQGNDQVLLSGTTVTTTTGTSGVVLDNNGSPKLATSASGIDITGATTTDALDLNAISKDITDTAVDVFVYDTSKDSDGGAWRKRTQGTSWYNETLNTATRGSRKEFPAVAVIVAESSQVTIYDGDDPDLPLWMVFNNSSNSMFFNTGTSNCVSSFNGVLLLGTGGALWAAHFVADGGDVRNSARRYDYKGNISQRNDGLGYIDQETSGALVHHVVNDVAMTVLPNAPIDAATGLPVPTIAIASNGGVSVIKDDGTVVDITNSNSNYTSSQKVLLIGSKLYMKLGDDNNATWLYVFNNIPTSDVTIPINAQGIADAWYEDRTAFSVDLHFSGKLKHLAKDSIGSPTALTLLDENNEEPSSGMVAYVASDHNTGWMNGAIKLATLSDTDDTNVTGAELVTGWVNGSTYAYDTLSTSGATVSSAITDGSNFAGVASNAMSLTAGKQYTVSFALTINSGAALTYVLFTQDQSGGGSLGLGNYLVNIGTGHHSLTFTAPSTGTFYLTFQAGNGVTTNFTTGAVSVRIAEEDRSVNGNGLQVFGTVTKNPVATGADLVGYTFSGNGSDYLQQPYNSDFNVGTGDFAFSFWFNVNTSAAKNVFELGGPAEGSTAAHCLLVQMQTTGVLRLYIRNSSNNAWLAPQLDSASINDGSWHCVSLVRNSGTVQWFVDGVAGNSDSTAFTSSNLGSTNALLRLGTGIFSTNNAFNGSLALWRISATAPSPEQIAKMYNDEKHLFQDGAQATLYAASPASGSPDAVTALAYDDATDLLHVGTDNGRSVFQGLRRVDNTTDAVGAAISASNGLVAED